MSRIDGRLDNEMRKVKITKSYTKYADGSVLISTGETKVLCTAMVEEKVPPFLRGEGKGWITAEYSMLPSSTIRRKPRDSSRGKIEGRTMEIQRLIGRALRSVVDLKKLGERTIWVDCDVIQADGGTRTAAITGAFVAVMDAINKLLEENVIEESPINSQVAAISVGIVDEKTYLDLCYEEDSRAEIDMNVVMNNLGEFIEIQGTGEERPFNKDELKNLLDFAEKGINELIQLQKSVFK